MKRSPTADVAALNRVRLNVAALIEDWPRLLRLLDEAAAGYPTGGPGGKRGKGGHTDLSDRLRYTPEVRAEDGTLISGGDLIPHQDPTDRDKADLSRALQLMLDGAMLARQVATRNLREPASANLCRGGCCPAGNMAERGKDGRCSACSRFWYKSSSAPGGRSEREYVGQSLPTCTDLVTA